MIYHLYENIVSFASTDFFAQELALARQEYFGRTGALNAASDALFEARMADFLEWFIFHRTIVGYGFKTPAQIYSEQQTEFDREIDQDRIYDLTQTIYSVFEYQKSQIEHLQFCDVITKKTCFVFERRKLIGLRPKNVLIGRLLRCEEKLILSENFKFVPAPVVDFVKKLCGRFAKSNPDSQEKLDFIHKILFCINKSEQYPHVPLLHFFEPIA